MNSLPEKQQKSGQPHDFGQFSELSDFMFNPISKSVAFIEFIGTFIFNILRTACVPAELIFRRNFGERHFNLYLYIGGSFWLGIFATGWLNIPAYLGFEQNGLISNGIIFTLIAIVFYGRMIWQLFIRKSGEIDTQMHTRYDGDPISYIQQLPLAIDRSGNPKEYMIRQFLEPTLMFVLGMICTFILNPQTGTWLIISSFCMAIKEYVKARYIRNIMLDQIDAEIIGKNMSEALKGAPLKDTQGVYIAGVSNEGKDRDFLRSLAEKKHQRFTAESLN